MVIMLKMEVNDYILDFYRSFIRIIARMSFSINDFKEEMFTIGYAH